MNFWVQLLWLDLNKLGDFPCDGKLHCEDGRCISKKVCCDRHIDANCTATYELPCCSKLLSFFGPDYPIPTHHQYHEIGFLQSTMYTIIGASCIIRRSECISVMLLSNRRLRSSVCFDRNLHSHRHLSSPYASFGTCERLRFLPRRR